MTTFELLSRLRNLGVALWVEGEEVRYRSEAGVLTPTLVEELRRCKPEILTLLRATSVPGPAVPVATIPRAAREGPLPLSFAQERLWFLEQLAPGTSSYNIATALPLNVPMQIDVLQASLDAIIARHEALRSTFATVEGRPTQVIAPKLSVPLAVHDLRGLEHSARTAEARRLATEEAHCPFDLESGPLVRASFVKLALSESLLLLTMHHIVSDGWSMGIFFRELSTIYASLLSGSIPKLPHLRIQYVDFAIWQRDWLQGRVLKEQVSYWKHQLADAPILQLPTDHPRPRFQTFDGATERVVIPGDLTDALKGLSRRENCTLFMTLLAGFFAVLARHTGQDDIVVGTYNAGRNRADTEDLIGFFINTLVLRTHLTPEMTFTELMRNVREVALAAYAHQDLPFPKLVEELRPDPDLSRNPLFQVVFHLFNAPTFPRPEMTHAPDYGSPTESASFDLVLNLMEGADGLFGQVEYNSNLFELVSVKRMMSHLTRLLREVAAAPDRPIYALPLLSDEERDELFVAGRGLTVAGSGDATICELFEAQAAATPDAAAFITHNGNCLTYRELDDRASRTASRLRALGVGPEQPVGICLSPSFDLAVALMAVLKAGGAYLPLDRAHPRERINFMVRDAGASVVVTDRGGAASFASCEVLVIDIGDDALGAPAEEQLRHPVPLSTLAYIVYTSGSTGRPKGVAVEHRQVLNRLHWMWRSYPFSPDEVCCQKTSVGFVDSIWELLGPLLRGVATVILPPDVAKDPYELTPALARHRVTRIWLVPSLLRSLLDTYPDLQQRVPSLTFWVTSGEELSHELAQHFLKQLPNARLYNLYGTSEVWDATWCLVDTVGPERRPVPMGRPIDNVTAHVLDETLGIVPLGVTGELYIGGVGLARGYFNHRELTAEKFIPNPFGGEPGTRLYRTGDLAQWRADGKLAYLGRRDHQIQVRGFRVELGEVEAVLRSHPAIANAAVIDCGDGADRVRLVAYVSIDSSGLDAESSRLDCDPVPQWQTIWDDTYRRSATTDSILDTAAFISSYTGRPIPGEEVQEWVDNVVQQVLVRRPRRVLEIGCGTGLLLFRIAPSCELYRASDFSAVAIEHTAAELARRQSALGHVAVVQRMADDFEGVSPESFDAVILHSVVQYFPSVEYLERVLTGAIAAVASGGFVLVGDVPCLGLLDSFHASVETFRYPNIAPDELERRVRRRVLYEKELWLDPAFFASLPGRERRLTDFEIRPKRGRVRNEFTRFRYDVALNVDHSVLPQGVQRRYSWSDNVRCLEELRGLLRDNRLDSIAVTGVPNARVVRDRQDVEAVEPEDLKRLGDELGATLDVRWSLSGRAGDLDILIQRRVDEKRAEGVAAIRVENQGPAPRPSHIYGNRPLEGSRAHALIPQLREFLAERLPEPMVPSQIVVMPNLPLTSSGKVNRVALARSGDDRRPDRVYVAPETAAERVFCSIWGRVLGVDQVGVQDDFFAELGGHSLLATQAVSRLQDALRMRLPLRLMFECPTIASLLAKLFQDPVVRRKIERTAELLLKVVQLSTQEIDERLLARRRVHRASTSVTEPETEDGSHAQSTHCGDRQEH